MADSGSFPTAKQNSAPITLRTSASVGGHRRTRSRSLFSGRLEDEDAADGFRTVRVNNYTANSQKGYASNELRTAKYTPLNMIPKSLFEQFKRVSNFYFLIIAAISYIDGVSPSHPITQALPLLVVVGFGFIRDIYEDLKRTATDRKSNGKPEILVSRENQGVPAVDQPEQKKIPRRQRTISLSRRAYERLNSFQLNPEDHVCVSSRGIAVGDIVFVSKGDVFPCDMVLLLSAAEGGVAYVSTANLDGESNLKRVVVAEAAGSITSVEQLRASTSVIRAQQPSPILHEFEGKMAAGKEDFTPLDSSNLLLRGSILRNTEYIYGVAMYTGYDTKVALNMRHPPSKMGDIEKKLNWVVVMLFVFLAVIVIISSGVSGYLQAAFGKGQWYMGEKYRTESGLQVGSRGLGTFLILFSTFIPVSLFVTLEFVRLVQGIFISADPRMKTGEQNAVARSTNLNETLGTIQHVLSDKTGTLTENIMRYAACSAGGHIYDVLKKKNAMRRAIAKDITEVKTLVWSMALCHSVVPEPKSEPATKTNAGAAKESGAFRRRRRNTKRDSKADEEEAILSPAPIPESSQPAENATQLEDLPDYQGQSPDEVALVTVARDYGVSLLRRTLNTMIIDNFGKQEEYKVLAELEFNSDRKRMSMILSCPDGRIRVITKGADTIMVDLLQKGTDLAIIQNHVDHFAKEGLRTLIFATKTIGKREFDAWYEDFLAARNSLDDREKLVSEVGARMEQDLEFIAVTAVEDKLQDRVPETIKFLREADVRLWVLTGDKRETAENIGYSANLLDVKMSVEHIKASSESECRSQLDRALSGIGEGGTSKTHRRSLSSSLNLPPLSSFQRRKSEATQKDLGIIIDGKSLKFAIENLPEKFMQLCDHAKTVICCRVTPLQKALVVRMVREMRQSMTLAIGDGGNDVSMIQEAHVGVGVFGKEGTQAAQSADYAIGEFKHLRQLVAVHGRYSQIRTAGLINLSFYKNLFFTLTQVYFQIFCFATGTTFHNQWIVQAFNVIVTSGPPFVFGIFEKDLDETTLFRFPRAYADARDRGCFSIRSVLEYGFVYGGWHSVVTFFGIYLCFGSLQVNYGSGLDSGFDLVALILSTTVVCMALFKFVFHTYIQNYIFIATIAISFALYFALVPLAVITPFVNEQPLNGLLTMMFRSPNFYITMFLIFVAGYTVDIGVLMWRRLMHPDSTYALQRWEQKERRSLRSKHGVEV